MDWINLDWQDKTSIRFWPSLGSRKTFRCCRGGLPTLRRPKGSKWVSEQAEILAIHDTFYVALKSGDADLMKTLWEEAEADGMPRVPWESVLSDQAPVMEDKTYCITCREI